MNYQEDRILLKFPIKSASEEEIRQIVSTKTKDWEHEEEYRIIYNLTTLKRQENQFFIQFQQEAISRIIFGNQMDTKSEKLILAQNQKLKVHIQRENFDANKPKINIIDL